MRSIFSFIYGIAILLIAVAVVSSVSAIGGAISFAKNLEASQFYYLEDKDPKVKLCFLFGPFRHEVIVPVREIRCPNCKKELSNAYR